jgi:flavonol synthase
VPAAEVTLEIGPHTDMCVVTILLPNDVEGLQIFKDGSWHDVPHVREAFIVFMGDQIETSKRPLTSRLPIRNMIVLLLDHSI